MLVDQPVEEDLIYDVGQHKGEDSEFYLRKGFRVVAIEALPSHAQSAEQRLRTYVERGKLVILNVAVAEKDGPLTFFESLDSSLWGTTNLAMEKLGERLGQKFVERTVDGVSFRNILVKFGVPYFLKIDIQGEDILCLRALRDFAQRPKYVSYESEANSMNGLREELTLLRELGYRRFKIVRQDTVHSQQCPFPAREGDYVDQRFDQTSSGLFGEEVPGEWVEEGRVIRTYRLLRFQRYLIRILSLLHLRRSLHWLVPDLPWYDIHAKRE